MKFIITSSLSAAFSAARAANKSLRAVKALFANGILSLDSTRLGSINSGRSANSRSSSFRIPISDPSLELLDANLKTKKNTIRTSAADTAANVIIVGFWFIRFSENL